MECGSASLCSYEGRVREKMEVVCDTEIVL